MSEAVTTLSEPSQLFGCARSTIHYTIKRHANHHTTKDLLRSSRPSKPSLCEKEIMCWKARAALKIGYSELAAAATFVHAKVSFSKPPSHITPYWCLKDFDLNNSRYGVIPKLNKDQALKCLYFCREHSHFQWDVTWGRHQPGFCLDGVCFYIAG